MDSVNNISNSRGLGYLRRKAERMIKLINLTDLAIANNILVKTKESPLLYASERCYKEVLTPDAKTLNLGQTLPMRMSEVFVYMTKAIMDNPKLNLEPEFNFKVPLVINANVFHSQDTELKTVGIVSPVKNMFVKMAFLMPDEERSEIQWPGHSVIS